MKRTPMRRRARLRARSSCEGQSHSSELHRWRRASASAPRWPDGDASSAAAEARIDPAHLIPRSLGGCGDPLCVVPLCRRCHRAYDRGELDLLPHLEPAWRAQLAHAVGHVGLIGALRRIGGRANRGDPRDDHHEQ